jgi:hypothetical protein
VKFGKRLLRRVYENIVVKKQCITYFYACIFQYLRVCSCVCGCECSCTVAGMCLRTYMTKIIVAFRNVANAPKNPEPSYMKLKGEELNLVI